MADKDTISNQVSEITNAAKVCGVDVWQILYAKKYLDTTSREDIYRFFDDNELSEPVVSKRVTN